MQIASGKVIDGRVVVDAELPEGAPELEAVLLQSIAQGERGETIPAEELLRELRSRDGKAPPI